MRPALGPGSYSLMLLPSAADGASPHRAVPASAAVRSWSRRMRSPIEALVDEPRCDGVETGALIGEGHTKLLFHPVDNSNGPAFQLAVGFEEFIGPQSLNSATLTTPQSLNSCSSASCRARIKSAADCMASIVRKGATVAANFHVASPLLRGEGSLTISARYWCARSHTGTHGVDPFVKRPDRLRSRRTTSCSMMERRHGRWLADDGEE